MDLEAAKLSETRAWTWARVSMVACFATASLMLLASLNLDHGSHATERVSYPVLPSH